MDWSLNGKSLRGLPRAAATWPDARPARGSPIRRFVGAFMFIQSRQVPHPRSEVGYALVSDRVHFPGTQCENMAEMEAAVVVMCRARLMRGRVGVGRAGRSGVMGVALDFIAVGGHGVRRACDPGHENQDNDERC